MSHYIPSMTMALPKTVDIAVIGSGFAGLAAAIEAANTCQSDGSRNRILVIEKMEQPGGNSVMNAGQVAAVNSKYQKLAGITDSVELMTADMLKAGVDLNHPNLLHKMISTSNDLVEWTKTELGIQYRERVTQLGGHSVPRTLSTLNASGNDIIGPMLQKIDSLPNINLVLNAAFDTFVMSDDRKDVEGISVMKDNQKQVVHCSRGVVLAAGGFSADVPFRSIQNPSFGSHVMSTNQPGATAEVIKEALKIGATPVQLSRIQLGPWTSPDEDGFGKAPFFCLGAGFPYGIIVDPETSKRFVNELGNRYERSMAILKEVGHPVVCLTDSDGAQHSLEKDLARCEPAVKSYNTISSLAKAYGMDPTVLQDTINDYNAGVEKNKDYFGKPFRDDLKPIIQPPFYATRLWPKVHHCMGGLHIDERAQVIHIDGHPIGGLFAAGEVVGGVHGGDRLGSCATLDCLSFGRIAGHSAAVRETSKQMEADLVT
jgi:flavocytochrome c